MRMDGTQPIMACMSPPHLGLDLGRGQVQLVMKHGHIRQIDFVKRNRGLHRLARQIHECFRFQKQNFFACQTSLADQPLKSTLPRRKRVIGGDTIQRHKAYVVTIGGIFRPWIAQTYK